MLLIGGDKMPTGPKTWPTTKALQMNMQIYRRDQRSF